MFGYGEGNDLLRYIWQEVKASLNFRLLSNASCRYWQEAFFLKNR